MTSRILENVYSKKDTYLFGQFCGGKEDAAHNHDSDDSQQLDTKELDIRALLNQPISERAKTFYDKEKCDQVEAVLQSTRPWTKDPNYFQNVHVSSLALLKMTMHAKSGGSIEVMGMLTGKLVKNGIVVMDVYPLPVEGTETRVNALSEGYEFMVQYLDSLKKAGREENIVGWYHSHPGYGCWLSGIDVSTQSLNQQFQDPYLAIVVDPMRTITNGLVEIGAFRTYSDEYAKNNASKPAIGSIGSIGASPANAKKVKGASKKGVDIPDEKIKDFGMHASKYYSLSVDVFRSQVDHMILSNLWNKFWISSLVGGTNDQDKREEMERFLTGKLTDLEKRMDGLKRADSKSVSHIRGPGRLRGADRSPPEPRLERDRDFPGMLSRFQQTHPTEKLSESFLQKSQLSPFTKANLLSKIKAKEPESEGSDSEMNDADSDMDLRQDTEDDTWRPSETTNQPTHLSRRRLRQGPQSSQSGANHLSADPLSIKQKRQDDKMKATAADAKRNLINLKLQEIIFLNE